MKVSKEHLEKSQNIMNGIIERCWDDNEFKKRLIENPVLTVEEFTGKPYNLPDGQTLKVIDQDNPGIVYFNIPRKPNLNDLELSESQLEAVSGGWIAAVIAAAVAGYAFGTGLGEAYNDFH